MAETYVLLLFLIVAGLFVVYGLVVMAKRRRSLLSLLALDTAANLPVKPNLMENRKGKKKKNARVQQGSKRAINNSRTKRRRGKEKELGERRIKTNKEGQQ